MCADGQWKNEKIAAQYVYQSVHGPTTTNFYPSCSSYVGSMAPTISFTSHSSGVKTCIEQHAVYQPSRKAIMPSRTKWTRSSE